MQARLSLPHLYQYDQIKFGRGLQGLSIWLAAGAGQKKKARSLPRAGPFVPFLCLSTRAYGAPPKPITSTGVLFHGTEPSPNWPDPLSPQH